MTTLGESIALVRDMLDEPTARQWTDIQIRNWINEARRDLSRRMPILEKRVTASVIAGTSEYLLAADILRIEAAYYSDASGYLKPLAPRVWDAMDNLWGQYQTQQGTPAIFTTYGNPPVLTLKMYPVPSTAGTLTLLVRHITTDLATNGSADSTQLGLPDSWSDLVTDYAEYKALRKDRDPRWQEVMGAYEGKIANLLDGLDSYTRATGQITREGMVNGLPYWLIAD